MKFTPEEEAEIQGRLAMGSGAPREAFFWLGALIAHRRGVPIERVGFQTMGEGAEVEEIGTALLRDAYRYIGELDWMPERLDLEIRIVREHLKRAGWPVSEGLLQ